MTLDRLLTNMTLDRLNSIKPSTSKLLLHACCAPCSLVPLQAIINSGAKNQCSVLFYNPNIHPIEEYDLRLSVLRKHLADLNINLIVGSYDAEMWEEEVGVFGGPYPHLNNDVLAANNIELRKKRCSACYRLRFKILAKMALENGYDCISTTLSISPYQYTKQILHELNCAANQQGILADAIDYSRYYADSVRVSRELGMYRQNYCGCRYSVAEAELERAERKEIRKQTCKETRKEICKETRKQAKEQGIKLQNMQEQEKAKAINGAKASK
ncbi:MAG: epoxyqueuosine reductase QueH [Coriobacteriales bacterium]|jgi:predicted adenine nucleotide alpha hydrolase (AANH) superfamily ATPase|nr:epoxyqueuosine reductase QueH [Coriobacteriales bacterium]